MTFRSGSRLSALGESGSRTSLRSDARPSQASALAGRALAWCDANGWTIALWGAMTAWASALLALVYEEYRSFQLGRFDLGNMVQAVWNTTQGRPLEMTTAAGDQIVRLGIHVDPILLLLTPFWMVVSSPLTLAAVQIAAVSFGALPVFWLARKHLGSEKAAALLAFAYLASPWVAWTAFDAMHPKTFAIPLFLFAVWFLDEDRVGAFAVAAVLAAACGELMGITIGALGVWYALARGRRLVGVVIAGAGAAWTSIALLVVVPAFSGDESVYYDNYASVGGSPAGILRTAFTDPLTILGALIGVHEVLYVLLLAVPLAGAFVLAPWLAAVALPQLLVNALADVTGPTDPRHHYIAGVLPFLVAAAAIGLGRVRPARRPQAAGIVLASTVIVSVLLGPWPGIDRAPLRYELTAPTGHADALRRATALVPPGVPVAASNKAASHLAARRHLFALPVLEGPDARAEWIVLDTYDRWVAYQELPFLVERPSSEIQALRDRLRQDSSWRAVFEEAGVYVFRTARR
ncbi:MAG TPA: DUF2079 domain-containing protein [Gaiellaceae bacterium]|nr:DUF2079 domain-containing protein [Gaiellaceae bacterium]